MHNVNVIILITSFFIEKLDARILNGHLSTSQNWAFLARFCFLSEQGRFKYDFIIHNKDTEANLLLYYDDPWQWPSVYPSNKTCEEKESVLDPKLGQIVSLNPFSFYKDVSGCEFTPDKQAVRCKSYRDFISARPRWWFMAFSDCHSLDGLNITYWISLTNAEPGNFWREHFSADEFYILPELIIAVCVYSVLICFSFYTATQLKIRRLLHITYKLFMISLVAQLIGLLFEIYSYVTRALTGKDDKAALLFGNLFEACSETSFTTILILMSVGYTVTKSILTSSQRRVIVVFISITIFLQISLLIYESEVFDPGLVLYLYESPPGFALIALKICAWAIFVVCCYNTSKNYSTKFHFYGSLLSLGSSWFLFQPIVVLVITLSIDKWIRESLVKGCSLWVIFIGHVTFLFLTRPSTANSNFPFHIRTCQVVPIGGNGQGHSYEPQGQATTAIFSLSHSPQYNSNETQ